MICAHCPTFLEGDPTTADAGRARTCVGLPATSLFRPPNPRPLLPLSEATAARPVPLVARPRRALPPRGRRPHERGDQGPCTSVQAAAHFARPGDCAWSWESSRLEAHPSTANGASAERTLVGPCLPRGSRGARQARSIALPAPPSPTKSSFIVGRPHDMQPALHSPWNAR